MGVGATASSGQWGNPDGSQVPLEWKVWPASAAPLWHAKSCPLLPRGLFGKPQPDRNLPACAKGAKENSQVLQQGPA